ncbi:MAG: 2TM domain-containing protein [bacterium]|nr:2TM domain-containing protein [bacterium]
MKQDTLKTRVEKSGGKVGFYWHLLLFITVNVNLLRFEIQLWGWNRGFIVRPLVWGIGLFVHWYYAFLVGKSKK